MAAESSFVLLKMEISIDLFPFAIDNTLSRLPDGSRNTSISTLNLHSTYLSFPATGGPLVANFGTDRAHASPRTARTPSPGGPARTYK